MRNALGRQSIVIAALLWVTCVFSPSTPQASAQAQTAEESTVSCVYRAYLRAWKERDYVALDRLLSDNYAAVNFKGIVSTKSNEIATAKEDRDYTAMDGDVMSVTVFGNSAIASGLINASWKDEPGKLQQITLSFLAMLQKQGGEWRIMATQSTRLKKPNE